MQGEDYTSYHPCSHGRRRLGRKRKRVVTAVVLFVGLVIGASVGRWSVNGIHVFASKDPHMTVLDDFEGMWDLFISSFPKRAFESFLNLLYSLQKSRFASSESEFIHLLHET